MSLYYEAAAILANPDKVGGSLKSRIYKKKDLKSSPAQIFALITEASKWSLVLKDIIEKCGLLTEEKKLTPILALLLTHDLLLAKSGVAAHSNHVLKLSIHRHKARLSAEFTKARIRHGHATIEAFKQAVHHGQLEEGQDTGRKGPQHPRWVRVNTLKSTLEEQLSSTFEHFTKADNLGKVLDAPGTSQIYYEDPNIPNLLALPPKTDLSKSTGYTKGQIIFQDKASCFPAYLLDVTPGDGDAIDGCAAPGNKTTHLAAIISERKAADQTQKVIAFERDKVRTTTLQKMVKLASAETIVTIKGGSDFLATKLGSEEFANVGAILLDPSCSGTGIVGRDEALKMHLPEAQAAAKTPSTASKGKKRKRGSEDAAPSEPTSTLKLDLDDSMPEETPIDGKLTERLSALSVFQLRILTHAMAFPKARKITYSTCSIHFEENENVVFRALASPVARERGWRILKREQQVEGMKKWHRRGVWEDDKLRFDVDEGEKRDVLEACIRCDKGTEDGTMGFFVAGFVRDTNAGSDGVAEQDYEEEGEGVEEEWNGFSDEDVDQEDVVMTEDVAVEPAGKKERKKKKKKRKAHGR